MKSWSLPANHHQNPIVLDSDGNEMLKISNPFFQNNLPLIAAAPDMLTVLENCLKWGLPNHHAIERVIAKARGET